MFLRKVKLILDTIQCLHFSSHLDILKYKHCSGMALTANGKNAKLMGQEMETQLMVPVLAAQSPG